VDRLEGSAIFSLDRGELIEYNYSVATHIQASVQNQSIDDHKMTYRVRLQRTGPAR
jgi:hypothetical protein